jgi:3-phenylpropionate/trans-cinnamate dioxygenase ferredoxin component
VHTGKVLRGPARQDIQTYPVQIEGEDILVSLAE